MGSLVIVAVPAQDDYVWQLSSEKVPHLTLLFLGDAETNTNTETIVQFVEHAVEGMSPFYMDVDYRGVLGPDEADVVFFEKGWDFKAVETFRNQLLQNTAVKQAYNSTEQYPEWTPHLTLGYPATPAKEPESERRLYNVNFDRIAVWLGDFDGPEFRLKRPVSSMEGDAYMHDSMTGDEARQLLHYGKKGMKWGVITEKAGTAARATGRGIGKAANFAGDVHFEGEETRSNASMEIHRQGSKYAEPGRKAINEKYADRKPELKRTRATKFRKTPLRKQYDAEHQANYISGLNKAASEHKNWTGTREYAIKDHSEGKSKRRWEVVTKAVEHADDGSMPLAGYFVNVDEDADGMITSYNLALIDAIKQGEEFVEGLMHYGVKGMKWGQRNSEPTSATATSVTNKKSGKAQVKTTGGERQPAHKDALSAATKKQQLTKSGLSSLSNKDLQELATRMDLERRITNLNPQQVSKGKRLTNYLLGTQKGRSDLADAAGAGGKVASAMFNHRTQQSGSKDWAKDTSPLRLNP